MTSEQLVGQYIPTVGAAGVLAGLIIGGFKWANASVASNLRDSVALWLLGEPGQSSWSLAASRVFDALYGAAYFSRRAVIANLSISVLATGAAVFALLARRWSLNGAVLVGIATLGFVYLLPILLASYVKARWFSRRIAQAPSTLLALALLAVDLLLTVVVWAAWLIFLVLVSPQGENFLNGGLYFLAFVGYASKPILIASLLPSLLVALVVAALIARRLCVRLAPFLGRASKLLSKERVEKEPLSLVGEVLAALVFTFVCIYGLATGVA